MDNKPRLLRRIAQTSLNGPKKTIREGIYSVMSQKQCEAIVSESVRRWVVRTDKYRNPDRHLPADIDTKREEYYQALSVLRKAKAFVETLQQEMIQALSSFDWTLPKISDQVRLLPKIGGWIYLSPLKHQAEQQNLGKLKAKIRRSWGRTPLLDILKEAAHYSGFLSQFHSPVPR